MSDMLEKLLGVEKTAAGLVAEADEEAGRRTAQARLDAQKRHAELLKIKAAENQAALAAERTRIDAERESRNRAESDKLSRLPADQAAFQAAVISIMENTSE
jgi:vacuolar-type H+-ATPase subunit H